MNEAARRCVDGRALDDRDVAAETDEAGNIVPLDLQRQRAKVKALLDNAKTIRAAQDVLAQAAGESAGFEADPTLRFFLLQLRERAAERGDLTREWLELLRECPGEVGIVRGYARRLVREGRHDEALALIAEHFPEDQALFGQRLARAELLDDIRAYPQADAAFRALIDGNGAREARIAFAKRLHKRGLLGDAVVMLSPVVHSIPAGGKAARFADTLLEDYDFFRRLEPDDDLVGRDIKIVALKHAILHFRDRRSDLRAVAGRPAIALVTGNLGPGGAERQLSRLAVTIQSGLGGDGAVASRIDVLVKQFASESGSARYDFFLADLLAAGVAVHQLNRAIPVSPAHQGVRDEILLRLIDHVSPQVRYGVTRLLPWLRRNRTDVASLWQDGTCLLGALGALMAGTPIIHLVFRGLPPNIRRERFRPDYEILYRALSDVPGVRFVSNSRVAAREYARWLDLPIERFEILYNGVPAIATGGAEADAGKWQAFAAATADATETIGGVFRAEPDKRPLAWIRLAHRYLTAHPKARFVHVGDGRLSKEVQQLAQDLGITGRILFVGHSAHVGFWYSKMNVKVMLSRFEGLPNVLIEAQILGVPVVSTPAGGAEECFVDGVTGHLLADAEQPDLDDACAAIAHYAALHRAGAPALRDGQAKAQQLFSIETAQSVFARMCLAPQTAAAA